MYSKNWPESRLSAYIFSGRLPSRPPSTARQKGELGGRDSNPDSMVQSHVSYP